MMTILAWITFIPAAIFNILLWIAFFDMCSRDITITREHIIGAIVTFLLMFVPGVYLFGFF